MTLPPPSSRTPRTSTFRWPERRARNHRTLCPCVHRPRCPLRSVTAPISPSAPRSTPGVTARRVRSVEFVAPFHGFASPAARCRLVHSADVARTPRSCRRITCSQGVPRRCCAACRCPAAIERDVRVEKVTALDGARAPRGRGVLGRSTGWARTLVQVAGVPGCVHDLAGRRVVRTRLERALARRPHRCGRASARPAPPLASGARSMQRSPATAATRGDAPPPAGTRCGRTSTRGARRSFAWCSYERACPSPSRTASSYSDRVDAPAATSSSARTGCSSSTTVSSTSSTSAQWATDVARLNDLAEAAGGSSASRSSMPRAEIVARTERALRERGWRG